MTTSIVKLTYWQVYNSCYVTNKTSKYIKMYKEIQFLPEFMAETSQLEDEDG